MAAAHGFGLFARFLPLFMLAAEILAYVRSRRRGVLSKRLTIAG